MYSSVATSSHTTASHNSSSSRHNANVKRNSNNNLICRPQLCNRQSLLFYWPVDSVDSESVKSKSSSLCKCYTNPMSPIDRPPLTLIDSSSSTIDDIREATTLARHHHTMATRIVTHLPNGSTFASDPTECTTTSGCRNKHSQHSFNRTGKSKLVTHNTLLCALLMITCSCILISLCDATQSISTAPASGKTRKHSASPKATFIKIHNQQKSLSSLSSSSSPFHSSPIKFISIKRAVVGQQQQQKQPTKDDTKSIASISDNTKQSLKPTEFATSDHNQLTSSDSPAPVTINSVSKQLAATIISAAASTLAQTATESVLKAVQTGSGAGSAHAIKRPSKIYNLPVKFVSNGQPTNFVMGLKQHLASIKKSSAKNQKNSAKKTTNNKMGKTPVFKPNSKFIYLPLKYLSNAKPYAVKKGEY